jgi:UDP-N-acetylglucosamine 4,6-dehydratase (inverting)
MYKNKTILITGGTGSFGNAFIDYFVKKKIEFKKIVIFSRDEFKQHEMQKKYDQKSLDKIRFFLGDIRDKDRLKLAFKDIDIVIHAAALKQVPAAEYNPIEFIKTNIIGAKNITETALDTNVESVVSLSTDKACAPINLYGATKLCADKLFISSNNIRGKRKIKFSVVRYGNVFGSRGSVIPEFNKQKKEGKLKITEKNMTRFNIFMEDAIKMVLWTEKNTKGGEIVVPKLKSFKITDLAKVIAPNLKVTFTGIRPGEKIHETLITQNENLESVENEKYYMIISDKNLREKYIKKLKYKKFPSNYDYSSNNEKHILSIQELKKLLSNKTQ